MSERRQRVVAVIAMSVMLVLAVFAASWVISLRDQHTRELVSESCGQQR